MTKSTITRERIQQIIRVIDGEAYDEEEIREWLSSDEIMELSRMALAAMDSEPVEMPLDYLQGHKDGLEWASQLAEANHPETGDWLYDDPIELAKAIRKGPDMPPEQPVEDSEPVILYRQVNPVNGMKTYWAELDPEEFRHLKQHTDENAEFMTLYRHAQQPVMPDEMTIGDACKFVRDMRLFDDVSVIVMRTWNACRAAVLAAAPQPQNAPQNIPEIIPDCWCRTCRPVTLNDMRFVVCPDCGNKRCPRANDHRNACTGSNEPGQEGSAYPDTLQEPKP
ncbi:hypothetical protein [Klebsiella pneumoniae]|uniref:hypothetical protein n=1 Tax=Klebsiella pneumoniae TaxID=573 RepID=UPI000E2DE0E1|nr:hypothetical protein [Klebsiella pneumoniae]SXJ25795.1 Uncharacterised protein [Klebsiella pneumoniae]